MKVGVRHRGIRFRPPAAAHRARYSRWYAAAPCGRHLSLEGVPPQGHWTTAAVGAGLVVQTLKDCTHLSLASNGLGDGGVKVLAASLAAGGGAPNVVEVNLFNNSIGDEGCRRARSAQLGAEDALPRAERHRRPRHRRPRHGPRSQHRSRDPRSSWQ